MSRNLGIGMAEKDAFAVRTFIKLAEIAPAGSGWTMRVEKVVAVFCGRKKAFRWAAKAGEEYEVVPYNWAEAVEGIRNVVYGRDERKCVACGQPLTKAQAHLHESHHRGKGGEVSIDNCETRCAHCHLNVAHGRRKPQFSATPISEFI